MMAVDNPSPIPECVLLEEKAGMKFYELQKTLLFSYDPKIKIVSIGKENDFNTKNIFLMGETGAGKTCLLNALVNHLLGVTFEDNYRYILKDEMENKHKSKAESQTDYVVGYLVYEPPGSSRECNYMIIDTPGLKDSRGQQQEIEVIQQIRTFLQDVDGVEELHCIGFVVNGTIARLQKQFIDIVDEFCKMFGENVKATIRTLISFGYMKRPPVLEVLENSHLKDCKTSKFDNVSLYVCNRPNEDHSEEDITTSKSLWRQTSKVYDSFFNEVDNVKAVSLGLTRETLNEISNLTDTIDSLKQVVESYLDVSVESKKWEDKCKVYQTVMKANEKWEGQVEVRVKKRRNLKKFGKHEYKMETHRVVYEDKKKLYDEAKSNETSALEQIASFKGQIDEERSKVNEIVKQIIQLSESIKENSLSHKEFTAQELIDQTLMQIKLDQLNQTDETERHGYVSPILESLGEHIFEIY